MRWQKVWKDFWSNKTRTTLMVLTILVGVFSVGLVNNMSRMMSHDLDADFHSANPSEAKINAYPLDESWVRSLRNIPGVGDLEGRTQLTAKWVKPDGQSTNIQLSGIKSIAEMHVNRLKPADGSDIFPALGLHDVVFDRSTNTIGLQPGQMIEVELPGGDKHTLRFTGYVHDVTTPPYSMTDVISAYITRDTVKRMDGDTKFNQLLVSVSENPTDRVHVSDVVKKITDRMYHTDVIVSSIDLHNPGYHFAWEVVQGGFFILGLFGWMTVILSGFLIVNTIVALMSQQTRQIGVMKAIGADSWQIFPMYLALILSFGGLAFLISVPLANLGGRMFMEAMTSFLNFDLSPTTIYPDVIVLQALVAFLAPLMATLIPMLNGLRISVREALSGYGLGGGSQTASHRESRLSFIARPVLLSLRNAFRRKARVSLTIFTLVLGGAMFISVFNLWASFDQAMCDTQGYFLADINVSLTRNYPFKTVNTVAMSVPGVERVEGWLVINAKLVGLDDKKEDGIAFVAPPTNSTLIQPSMVAGRWLTPGDKNVIVVGNHLQKIRPDLKIGDWVTARIDGKRSKWQIIGFYLMPGDVNAPLVYTSYEYLSYKVGMMNQIYEARIITYNKDMASQNLVSDELQRQFKQHKIEVAYAQTAADWLRLQKNNTDMIVYYMLIMAALVAVVGGLGLMSTMSLTVLERTREIGVMRAIGAADGDIQRIVITEGLAIGVLSWMLGVMLSIPITFVLDYGVGISIFQSPLNAVFSWTGSFVWLFGILLVAVLASAIPALRASRLAIRETLVYE